MMSSENHRGERNEVCARDLDPPAQTRDLQADV